MAARGSTPESQLDGCLDKYTPAIAMLARACLAKMCARLPGAVRLVYDNYNALVIGFGPSERASACVFSIALYPRWVTLFFLHGAGLPDPRRLLKGSGKVVRHIKLASPADLDLPAIQALMAEALQRAGQAIDPTAPGRLVIQSISARQRPRRPA
jgi:hypothetical protein